MARPSAPPGEQILSVRDLCVLLPSSDGLLEVVSAFHLDVAKGQIAGVAGESGSGKTASVMAALRLLPPGSVARGRVSFLGQDLLACPADVLGNIRGRQIGLLMQDPNSSLHPMLSIGAQLTDHMRRHLHLSRTAVRRRAVDLLRQVQLPDPAGALDAYPHQFSGGMRQRVALAIALACEPQLLIADEPTTGLDVTVQAGILHLLDDLRNRLRLGVVLITHDLGVISVLADSVTIMYAGRVVESGRTSSVLNSPRHPYTSALLRALPHPDHLDMPLIPIPGQIGSLARKPTGCSFHTRCAFAKDTCSLAVPELVECEPDHRHACGLDALAAKP